jgi:crotonobetainyl-CoA:carnitine CoA-transferase CaiB-like acyl-CoA transferase
MTPLEGVRVLDFSKVLAGPLCAQWLGDLGAEVTKIEPPAGGDDTRGWPPFRGAVGAVFLSANLNNRPLTLDLKTEAGRDAARRMVKQADVLIESYATGVAERLGIGAEAMRALNPRLVYCSISGFGRSGPLKDGLGYDVILQAFSGIMAMTGERGGGPSRSPFSPIDQSTGMNALSGILAALLERHRSGQGCRLEVSLFETAAALLGCDFQIFWEKGSLPEKSGSGHESLCPYQAFDAAERPVLIGIANDNLWRRFTAGIGRAALGEDPRFRTNADRVARFAETVALVQGVVAMRTADEWVAFCLRIGIPCAAVNTIADMLAHPHMAARGMVMEYEHPRLGSLKATAQADRVRRQDASRRHAAVDARRAHGGGAGGVRHHARGDRRAACLRGRRRGLRSGGSDDPTQARSRHAARALRRAAGGICRAGRTCLHVRHELDPCRRHATDAGARQ